MLFFLFYLLPFFSESINENTIYESILKESYYETKIKLGETLGSINTKSSDELLKKLLINPYHWNREAAIAGILTSKKPEFNELVIKVFLTDPIISSRIRREFMRNMDFYIETIIKTYETETNPKYKNILHNLIAISPNSEEYFTRQIETKSNPKTKEIQK